MTPGINVFELVKNIFNLNNIDLQVIRFVCTDRATSVFGNRSGRAAVIKKEIPTFNVNREILLSVHIHVP